MPSHFIAVFLKVTLFPCYRCCCAPYKGGEFCIATFECMPHSEQYSYSSFLFQFRYKTILGMYLLTPPLFILFLKSANVGMQFFSLKKNIDNNYHQGQLLMSLNWPFTHFWSLVFALKHTLTQRLSISRSSQVHVSLKELQR